jgi:ligand-binding sensor domain-containing protein
MALDSKGAMWFANYDLYTMDVGISKKDNAGWTTYTVANGLINAQLKRMAVDQSDNVWIATSAGVSKFTEASSGIAQKSAFPVSIYPNPAATEIHLDRLTGSGTLTILECSGRALMAQPVAKGSNTIALAGIKPGVYILRYQTGTEVFTEKLIIR